MLRDHGRGGDSVWNLAVGVLHAVATRSHGFRCIVVSLLRELGDERPYGRYLVSHGCEASPEAWRRFQDQRAQVKYANPRCC